MERDADRYGEVERVDAPLDRDAHALVRNRFDVGAHAITLGANDERQPFGTRRGRKS